MQLQHRRHLRRNKGKWALVCQGGGGKGAWEAGFIYGVVKFGNLNFTTAIGASVGALNCVLYMQCDADSNFEKLSEVWQGISSRSILGRPTLFSIKNRGFFSSGKLEKIIRDNVFPRRLSEHLKAHSKVFISLATRVIREGNKARYDWRPFVFGAGVRSKEARDPISLLIPSLLASSAVPFIFPEVRMEGQGLRDGGLAEGNPLNSAEGMQLDNVLVLCPDTREAIERTSFLRRQDFLYQQFLRRIKFMQIDLQGTKRHAPEDPMVYLATPSRELQNGDLKFSGSSSRADFTLGVADARQFMLDKSSHNINSFQISNMGKGLIEWYLEKRGYTFSDPFEGSPSR